jgi:hypothetical protein
MIGVRSRQRRRDASRRAAPRPLVLCRVASRCRTTSATAAIRTAKLLERLFVENADASRSSPAPPTLWDELFPAEQARIVQLLVERVDLRMHGVEVRLRPNGLAGLVREMAGGRRAAA